MDWIREFYIRNAVPGEHTTGKVVRELGIGTYTILTEVLPNGHVAIVRSFVSR